MGDSKSGVTIISDGTANGTKVMVGDEFIHGVTRIEIAPLSPMGTVRAKITVDFVHLRMAIKDARIECTDADMAEKIRRALLVAYDPGLSASDTAAQE